MPFIYAVILFIVSLMLIFLYLVEPFITRQKIRNNNEHGSARWATKQEIEKDFKKEEVKNINEMFYIQKIINKYGLIQIPLTGFI